MVQSVDSPPHSAFEYTLQGWKELLLSWGQPAFRAGQIYRQIYVRMAGSFGEMSDLPVTLRQKLAETIPFGSLKVERVIQGDDGLTRKALLRLPEGHPAETVLMVYADRATVCVSSQSGCPMACSFCATGKLGFLHDLTAGQIVEQVLWAERTMREMAASGADFPKALSRNKEGHWLTNIVFMGMGEPFNNFDNWWGSVERLHDPEGYNMGARNMTVSTVGLIPGIKKLGECDLPVNLAVSLHAPNDEMRSGMMPVNRRYPVADLVAAVREYAEKTGRRVSFEYVLLQEQNDSPEQARELARLLSQGRGHLLCHVNLIPWNPIPGTPLNRSTRQRVVAFQAELEKSGIPCTVRVERGIDIGAACGQLAGTGNQV